MHTIVNPIFKGKCFCLLVMEFYQLGYVTSVLYLNRIGSLASGLSALYASGPEINPCVLHILSWEFFPSSADSRRASYQLLVKE